MLQSFDFLFRVELGEGDLEKDTVELSQFELASRLAFFLTGEAPDKILLDKAEANALRTPNAISDEASRLLDRPEGRRQFAKFHAMWLGYTNIQFEEPLSRDMRNESDALIKRVVFEEDSSWLNIFRLDETFVTPALADHYGFDSPGNQPGWITYQDTQRAGILGHGSFLSQGDAFGDTSPTQRGLLVRTRLMCEDVPELTPEIIEALGVDVDAEPSSEDPNACQKREKWPVNDLRCAGCHAKMDSIGFGLERYDLGGVQRNTEPDDPSCTIDDEGEIRGVGTFRGPKGLAEMLLNSGRLDACMTEQLAHFVLGRPLSLGQKEHGETRSADPVDIDLHADLLQTFRESDHSLKALLISLAVSTAFSHKKVAPL